MLYVIFILTFKGYLIARSILNILSVEDTINFFDKTFLVETTPIFNFNKFIENDYWYDDIDYILIKLNDTNDYNYLNEFKNNFYKLNEKIIFFNMFYTPNSNILISTYYDKTGIVLQFFEVVSYNFWNLERLSQTATPTWPNQKIFFDKTGIFIQDFNMYNIDKFMNSKDLKNIEFTAKKEHSKLLVAGSYLFITTILHTYLFLK